MYYLIAIGIASLWFLIGFVAESIIRRRVPLRYISSGITLGCLLLLTTIAMRLDNVFDTANSIHWIADTVGISVFALTLGSLFRKVWNILPNDELMEKYKLERKLSLVKKQTSQLFDTRDQEGMTEESYEAISEALSFLRNQQEIIKLRIKVLEYIDWEKNALKTHDKYFAENYLKGNPNFHKIRENIQLVIKDGNLIIEKWNAPSEEELYLPKCYLSENESETKNAVIERGERIINGLINLTNELGNYETVRALKEVRQLAVKEDVPLLMPGDGGESMEMLQQIQLKPLKEELLFEKLRIEALKEIK